MLASRLNKTLSSLDPKRGFEFVHQLADYFALAVGCFRSYYKYSAILKLLTNKLKLLQ